MHLLYLYGCVFLFIWGRGFFYDLVKDLDYPTGLKFFSLMCLKFKGLFGFGVPFPVYSFHVFCVLFCLCLLTFRVTCLFALDP